MEVATAMRVRMFKTRTPEYECFYPVCPIAVPFLRLVMPPPHVCVSRMFCHVNLIQLAIFFPIWGCGSVGCRSSPRGSHPYGEPSLQIATILVDSIQNRQMKPESAEMELIPGLPDDISLDCLARLPYTCHPTATNVSHGWKDAINGADFSSLRKRSGRTQQLACLLQARPDSPCRKPLRPPTYGVTVFDPARLTWERLPPVPGFPDGLPLFCRMAAAEGGKLVLMGGWDPISWGSVRSVLVYDFAAGEWRRGKDMPAMRSFFAAAGIGGRVYVAGGHDDSKNALRTAAVYDVGRDEWGEMPEMEEERDECEGVAIGGEFWVVSGYATERQGKFGSSAEVFESSRGEWRRIEGAWEGGIGECPRGCCACAGVNGRGRVVWLGEESAVRVGPCAVGLGERILLTGTVCPGAPHGFYMVRAWAGQNDRVLERLDVPEGFGGFVQSGCCVQI
ncbi:hypothetical protein ACLOJK_021073 [Asimina triloba]